MVFPNISMHLYSLVPYSTRSKSYLQVGAHRITTLQLDSMQNSVGLDTSNSAQVSSLLHTLISFTYNCNQINAILSLLHWALFPTPHHFTLNSLGLLHSWVCLGQSYKIAPWWSYAARTTVGKLSQNNENRQYIFHR